MDDRKNVQIAALLIEKDQELAYLERIATFGKDVEKLKEVTKKRIIVTEALEELF